MPGPWPRRACSAPTARPIASPTPRGTCGAGCRSGTPWSGRARAISRSSGPCSGSTATASRPAVRRASSIASGACPCPAACSRWSRRCLPSCAPSTGSSRTPTPRSSTSPSRTRACRACAPSPASAPSPPPPCIAAIDDAQRFRLAHQLEAYFGLVPREYSSGETQRRGAITKAGHSRTRGLLIQSMGNTSPLRRRSLRGAPPAP